MSDRLEMRRRIIGLGEDSARKSFYPELQQRLQQLEDMRESLRVSQENLLSVFNSVHDAILISDREGRILEANQAATQMFGLPRGELCALTYRDLCRMDAEAGQSDPSLAGQLARMDQQGFSVFEVQVGGPGAWIDAEVALRPATWYGQDAIAAVVRDITDRKQAEALLRQAQKLESLGQLAGGVAHDTNNMLSVIIGYSDLLLEDPDPAPATVRQHLTHIRKAAIHSSDLTRQLLAFARKQTIQPRPIDVNALVDELQGMLRRLIGENHALVWKPATTAWTVWVDPSQVNQVLVNLVVNARDANEGAGTITLETRNQTVDEAYAQSHLDARPGDYVVLAVTDTGRGMGPEVMSHIFEPFFTTKEVGKGTGLGLAMVYGILRQNGGFITVYSAPGQGASFRLHLPRYVPAADEAAREKEAPAPAPGGWETVLLVEDEEALLDLGSAMLREAGYRVLACAHPAQALELLSGEEPGIHVLVTDMVMPGMNGAFLAREVLKRRPGAKVLFMSGYPMDAAGGSILEPSAVFLQKPFSRRDLLEKLRGALDARKPWNS